MKITNFAVKNYQFTMVVFIMIAVVGLITMLTMPRAEDPTNHPPTYLITVLYPGTSPKEMEEQVVKPIEKKIYQLENIDKLVTTIKDGLVSMQVDFKFGVDVDNKYQEISTEVNALKNSELPKDIPFIEVQKISATDVNILQVALVSQSASAKDLRDYADNLKSQLEKITDLKKVDYTGLPEQEIRVDIQIDKLARLKIPLTTVVNSLQSEGADINGGNVYVGTKSFNIKTSGKYKDAGDVSNTVIYNENGKIVYLRDVADVSFKNETQTYYTRLNGYRCALVSAGMKENISISATQAKFLPILAAFDKTLPPNIKMVKTFDQAQSVDRRLGGLGEDFAIAIFLVLLTLLPLGTRASIIVMITIPVSIGLGLIILKLFGYTLNQLTIIGLVLALGLLVDDSIVVVENIERWLREGHSRMEAVIKGTAQIGMAVLGCTATLIIAFLPLCFLPGTAGEFVRGLPMAVISCVFASFIVSLTLVPFLASRILKKPKNEHGNYFLRALQKFINLYGVVMVAALKRPWITVIIAVVVVFFAMSPNLGFKLFPASEKPMFIINIGMPLQSNLLETDSVTKLVEKELQGYSQIKYYTSNIGKGNPQIYYNLHQQDEQSDFAQIFVQLQDDTKPTDKTVLIQQLRTKLANFPYAKVVVKDFEQGPPIEAPIVVRLFGDNLDSIRKYSFQVENILRSNKNDVYVTNELNVYKTDIRVDINREKARTLGILTGDVDETVRLAVAGIQVAEYADQKGDNRRVVINAPFSKYATLDAFKNLYVNNAQGQPVALDQIASIHFEKSPTAINHANKTRFAKVTSLTRSGVLANNVLKEVVPKLNALKLPPGYYYKLSGEAESEGDTLNFDFLSVIVAFTFLFIAVLILQFKNFKGVLIVLSVIPLGVIGGVLALWLTGYPGSLATIIGFIGLSGIEVKNSLLFVDFTNQLRKKGMALDEAIHHAGETRFLPVVLTSLTAIFGLMPIAMNSNPNLAPLAIVTIGGLITSTLLSRILTPVIYKLMPPRLEEANEEAAQATNLEMNNLEVK